MRVVYTVLIALILPFVLLRLWWRGRQNPGYRQCWPERFGYVAVDMTPGAVWVHAVSVGEVQAISSLINRLLEQGSKVLVSTTTPTGRAHARNLFGDKVRYSYFPYDLPPFIARFIDRVRPRCVLVVETEIWPNMLAECNRREIPVMLANARLSARSATGYARIAGLTREALDGFSLIAAQGQADAERFIALGAGRDKVRVTGNIKFDVRIPASLLEQADVINRMWGESRHVWVAASTHDGEDEIILAAHQAILRTNPNALLALVPRHPERFDRVALLARKHGFKVVRRSDNKPCSERVNVFVGDTMGELVLFMAAADVAFVGGSLVPNGGHNILEPAALGLPVAYGPHMFNFLEVSQRLEQAGAAVQVRDADDLCRVISRWLSDPAERSERGDKARKFVADNHGALDQLEDLFTQLVEHAADKAG